VVIAAALLWLDVGDFGTAPPWTVIVAPFFYAVLSLVLVPRATLQRRLRWVGGACLTHVSLGLAAAIAFWALVEVTLLSALAYAFARLGPVPFLTLLATALALVPFRGRVLSPRPAPRVERAHQAAVAAPTPALAFAATDVEFRRRYPGLKLTLPLDDVLRQLPRGAIPASGMPSQIAGLEAFPAPFQPLSVPREVPPESAPAPSLPPSVAVAAPPAAKPAPVFAPD